MFDCGINKIVSDMMSSIETEEEKMILKAVQSVGIDVDKEQLEKALFNAKSFYDDGYKDAKKQYEPRWIPVSSGNLPDYRQRVLIQLECERTAYIADNEVIKYDVAFRVNYKHPMFDADYYWMGKTAYNPTDVIAWQLPEPYKESEVQDADSN